MTRRMPTFPERGKQPKQMFLKNNWFIALNMV